MSAIIEDLLDDISPDELEARTEKDVESLSDAEVTQKIRTSVRNKFEGPLWVLAFEFAHTNGRRADAIAINTSASHDFPIVGFEFKASRSDWLSEVRNHEKAEPFIELCDEWYVVAGRRGIVEEDELPPGWGLLELKPQGALWELVECDLSDRQDIEPDRRFWAKLMRKVIGEDSNFDAQDIREAHRRGYESGKDYAAEHQIDREVRNLQEDAKNWRKIKDRGLRHYGELSEDEIDRLERAKQLLEYLEGDGMSDLENRIETVSDRAHQAVEHLDNRVESVVGELESLRADLPDGGEDGS